MATVVTITTDDHYYTDRDADRDNSDDGGTDMRLNIHCWVVRLFPSIFEFPTTYLCLSVCLSVGASVGQSVSRSVNRSVCRSYLYESNTIHYLHKFPLTCASSPPSYHHRRNHDRNHRRNSKACCGKIPVCICLFYHSTLPFRSLLWMEGWKSDGWMVGWMVGYPWMDSWMDGLID